MARPRTPIGAYGEINTRRVGGRWEATTRFRNATGGLDRVKRVGKTKTEAVNRLKAALAQMAEDVNAGAVNRNTRLSQVAEAWIADRHLECDLGQLSPLTVAKDESNLRRILPALGELALTEVTTARCDAFLKGVARAGLKTSSVASIRTTLSALCGFAIRQDAIRHNPVRDVARLKRSEEEVTEPRALTAAERADLFAKLDADRVAQRHDLPDLLRVLLATGLRLSELLACASEDFVRDSTYGHLLRADHRIIQVRGGVQRRKRSTSSTKGGPQQLLLPSWAVPILSARKLRSTGARHPLFPDPLTGDWRSPSSYTQQCIRAALDRAGYPWVRSHSMRKTVGTVVDASNEIQEVSKQLGHRQRATSERFYIERRPTNEAGARALEGMWDLPESGT